MAAASSLGVRYGRTISFLNAEETESRLGRRITTDARPVSLHHLKPNSKQETNNNKKKKKQMMIISRGACLISNNLGRAAVINSSSSSSSSSSSIHLDLIFKRANAKIENKVGGVGGEQQQRYRQVPPPPISTEKLDEWINYSVSEIVRNIGETPLLMQVYSKNKVGSSSSSSSVGSSSPIPLFERSKAEPESWASIRRSWEEGSPVPDGIILVEPLMVDDNEKKEEPTSNNAYSNNSSSSSTKTWGVVIQGRGADSASSCYILKTCRVGSPFGFCTHFCLVRAKCFGEIADLQLKNSWLLN